MKYSTILIALLLAACGGGLPDVADNSQVQDRGAGKDNWWDALPREEWSAFEKLPQEQDWFEVYRVSEGVHAIYEPGQFEEVISFLVTGEDRALLFDTGLGIGDMRRVVETLTDLPVVVLNSHTHYDHIGGNWQFDTVWAADTDYTREHSQGSTPAAVAGFLQDGEIIDLGGRELEVLMVPGHAPDALCLLDREHRILFTGDTFYLAPLYAHLEGSDFEQYAASAARLAGLAEHYDHAYTAHNVPVVDGGYIEAMADAFAAIRDGTAGDYTPTDGNREYAFDGFSIIVPD